MRVCCFRVTVPAVQYDPRISSGSRDRIPCQTLSRLFDALGSLARGQLPAFLPRASGIRSHPPNPRELFRMGYMKGFTSVRICTGRITRTVTPEDSVLFARYLRVLASQQVMYVRYLPRCTYPCVPGKAGEAHPGRLDLSGYRYGTWQLRGPCQVVGRYTIMASSIPPAYQTLRKEGPRSRTTHQHANRTPRTRN